MDTSTAFSEHTTTPTTPTTPTSAGTATTTVAAASNISSGAIFFVVVSLIVFVASWLYVMVKHTHMHTHLHSYE